MQKEIAYILQHKLKDPRITMVTISSVETSSDLTHAKVFVTFLHINTPEQIKTELRVLQDATGFIRTLLAKSMHLRTVPKLTFIYDCSLTNGIYLANLIDQIVPNNCSQQNISTLNNLNSFDKEN
ncbi:ribosome-binding factor A [secondary endosymbiont of Heteropsylla cubana]|uniref:Ribosome-binding factor A n=2 Tax=secondary endosymbiont of Heteropsylla cubana TaxID=134287 RepID=J7H0N5_9ENTR|nr:ribosome-binding factor A [secondary endosymbiont of Heteropsylla cubana]